VRRYPSTKEAEKLEVHGFLKLRHVRVIDDDAKLLQSSCA